MSSSNSDSPSAGSGEVRERESIFALQGRIRLRAWWVDELEAAVPGWSSLPAQARHNRLRGPGRSWAPEHDRSGWRVPPDDPADRPEAVNLPMDKPSPPDDSGPDPDKAAAADDRGRPVPPGVPVAPFHDERSSNIAVNGFLRSLAAGMDPTTTEKIAASHLAVGDGDTMPVGTNEAINNEVYRTKVGDAEPDDRDLLTSTFVSQNEANGVAIREVGLTTGRAATDWTLLTHSVMDPGAQIEEKTSNMTLTVDYVIEFKRIE